MDGLYSDARALSVNIKIFQNRVEVSVVVEFSSSGTTSTITTKFYDYRCPYSILADFNVDAEGSSVRIKSAQIKSDKVC